MKKLIIVLSILISINLLYSQESQKDSLMIGRYCNIVLYNKFQAEGKITGRNADTVWLETDITLLHIPIKDIKLVLNSEFELNSDGVPEIDSPKVNIMVTADTTDECDLYLDGMVKLSEMKLIPGSDSTFFAIKGSKKKEIKYSDVRKIVFKVSAPFGRGYLVGSGIGFIIGFLPLALSKGGGHPDFSGVGPGVIFGLICSIPAGLIGGVFGVLAANDDVHMFDKGDYVAKTKKIKYIIQKHH
ncbi:MAG: hypothetical protein K8I03_04345 [Ignavibacteria bacterium]|nr:hypothetical protein [Ignavibacteria bacterium]